MSNSPLISGTAISPNRTVNRNSVIDHIIPHCFVGQVSAESGAKAFASKTRAASCNYVIGHDGKIFLVVDEKDRSWCTGGTDAAGNPIRVNGISGKSMDYRSITIEVASDAEPPYAVTPKAYEALIALCTDICKRNKIPALKWKADKNLVGKTEYQNLAAHRWFARKSCPGDWLFSRFGLIAAEVNRRLAAGTTTTTAATKPQEATQAPKVESAQSRNTAYSKAWTVLPNDGLNMRYGAGTDKSIITTLPKGARVQCYGYYNVRDGVTWLYVSYNGKTGYVSKAYLQ